MNKSNPRVDEWLAASRFDFLGDWDGRRLLIHFAHREGWDWCFRLELGAEPGRACIPVPLNGPHCN